MLPIRRSLLVVLLAAASAVPPPAAGATAEVHELPVRSFGAGSSLRPPAPGELVVPGDSTLAYLHDGAVALRLLADADPQLIRRLEGGRITAFALVVGDDAPVPRLSPEQLAELRSLRIDGWSPAIERLVAGTDPLRCVYVLAAGAYRPRELTAAEKRRQPRAEEAAQLVRLRPDARHVVLDSGSWSSDVLYDRSSLRSLGRLETLAIRDSDATLDDLPTWAGRLSALHLSGMDFADLRPLARFASLRTLSLRFNVELRSLDGVERLRRLRELDLRGCVALRSVAPLAMLPSLEALDLTGLLLEELPQAGWPVLQRLAARQAFAPEGAFEAFAAGRPGCRVERDGGALLREATRGADRVRLRTGGTCHVNQEEVRELLVLEGDEAERFLEGLEFRLRPTSEDVKTTAAWLRARIETAAASEPDDRVGRSLPWPYDDLPELRAELEDSELHDIVRWGLRQRDACLCCGGPTFEILARDRLLATLGNQHGRALRWLEGGLGDLPLTAASAEELRKLVEPVHGWDY